MKAKLAVAALLAFLVVGAGSAEAFVWHLSLYKAKAATKSYERENCKHDGKCIAYGASCKRITESRIDCIGGTVDETAYGELECQTIYHWGVGVGGRVKLRVGDPDCYYLE